MSSIPGLSVCPAEEGQGGVEVESFFGTISIIPESQRYGNCHMSTDYDRLGTISDGEFGKIYKCRHKRTNKLYALKKYKIVENLDGFPPSIVREMNILSKLKHENIVNSHGALATKNIESNYLLLDYYVTSLDNLIVKEVASLYDADVVKCIMKQLFKGLDFIHESLIIHRNLNCKNIVFGPDGLLKITEFNTSRFYSRGNMTPKVTELIYRAPELLFQARHYDMPVDMWSAGCIFARLLLKKPIFTGSSEIALLESITEVLGKPSESIWPGFNIIAQSKRDFMNSIPGTEVYALMNEVLADLSIASKELVQDILVYDPKVRFSANSSLKSPYFREAPRECSLDKFLSSILKDIISADEPMDQDE